MDQSLGRNATGRQAFSWSDFFSFRKMIALPIMQIVYMAVAALITVAGLKMLFSGDGSYNRGLFGGGTGSGVFLLLFGNVIWRLWCEVIIVLFRINSSLRNIDNNTQRQLVNTPSQSPDAAIVQNPH